MKRQQQTKHKFMGALFHRSSRVELPSRRVGRKKPSPLVSKFKIILKPNFPSDEWEGKNRTRIAHNLQLIGYQGLPEVLDDDEDESELDDFSLF